jgi:hypothetical protein
MMTIGAFAISVRGLLVVTACAASSMAVAQSYSAKGQDWLSPRMGDERKSGKDRDTQRRKLRWPGNASTRRAVQRRRHSREIRRRAIERSANQGRHHWYVGHEGRQLPDFGSRRTALYRPAELPRRRGHSDPLYDRTRGDRADKSQRSGRYAGRKIATHDRFRHRAIFINCPPSSVRRSVHRRQRFDVGRDRIVIRFAQLGDVPDHARHRTAGTVAIGRLSSLQEISDILFAPVRKPFCVMLDTKP